MGKPQSWWRGVGLLFFILSFPPLAVLLVASLNLAPTQKWLWLTITTVATLSLALGLTYYLVIRPLRAIYNHLAALNSNHLTYRTIHPLRGWLGAIVSLINLLSDRLQQYDSHNQTELSVIKADADRLRNVINAINDGVIALDKDAHILLFNRAASTITGFAITEVAGQPLSQIVPLLKGNSLVVNDWLLSVAGSDITEQRWENVRLKTKDSKTRAVDIEALYQGTDPNGIRTLLTFHDRTEAQEVEDMKVDFVALAAHELRTPITVIRGYLEILETELGQTMAPEYREFFRKLNVSASQLSGFINNILHVSRIEHGDLNLNLEPTDWGPLITSACQNLVTKAQVQNKQLLLSVPKSLPPVAVDRMSIVEVINNLVDNAIKYSQPNSNIVVSVRAKPGNAIETTIQDQGAGIPENAIDKLFTKFYRSYRTRTSHHGTGLGLYMSKAIVEAHGGRIWVQSKVNVGSTFGFLLPIYDKLSHRHLNVNASSKVIRGVHGWIKNHSFYRG